jgi:hypothetical protein
MAADKFNALTGYSVGLPPIDAIAANGNIVTNHNYPAGNVTSNSVYANNYFYANGASFSSDPAGSNTEIQYNNNGVFGASANLVFDSATERLTTRNLSVVGGNTLLGDVQTVTILGGTNGYVLQTDGAGGLSWTAQSGNGGGGGNGSPGGSNMQVQFNSAGSFAGDAGFTYDVDNDLLHMQTSLA